MESRNELISKIKCGINSLEMYNKTKNEMFLNGSSSDAFDVVNENISSIEDELIENINSLKKLNNVNELDYSNDVNEYEHNLIKNAINEKLVGVEEDTVPLFTTSDCDLILKSNQFYIVCDDGCLRTEYFDGIEEHDGKLTLYLYDIDYVADDSCCIPCVLHDMLIDKDLFNIEVHVTDSSGNELYVEKYVDVCVEKFERYFGLTNKNTTDSKFEVTCTYRYKRYFEVDEN